MERLELAARKNTTSRYINIEVDLSSREIDVKFRLSNGAFQNFFDDLVKRIYEHSSMKYIDVFNAMVEIPEAYSYITSYLDDVLAVNLKEYKSNTKIYEFNEPYVKEFVKYYSSIFEDDNPFSNIEEDEELYEMPKQKEEKFEFSDLDSIEEDWEPIPTVIEENPLPSPIKTFQLDLSMVDSVLTDDELTAAVNDFIKSKDKYEKLATIYNNKARLLKRELEIKKEIKQLELQKAEIEILSLEIDQLILNKKDL